MINKFHIGDNLEVMTNIESGSVDLIYIDPPYSTGRDFGHFVDKFESSWVFAHEFIKPRLIEAHRVLKSRGTIVVHVEPAISHYIRIVLDEVFGEGNFINEIVWVSGGNKQSKKKLQRNHDTILVYGKTKNTKFNPIYLPYSEEYNKGLKWDERHQDWFSTSAAHNSQPDVNPRPNLRYEWKGNHRQWYVTKDKMKQLHDEGRLQYSKKTGIPRFKKFLGELKGVQLRDVWTDISSIQNGEKLNYATQKPVKLLERIVQLYSDEGDLVLDFFAGSGTTGRACRNLGRNYILIDISEHGKSLFDFGGIDNA